MADSHHGIHSFRLDSHVFFFGSTHIYSLGSYSIAERMVQEALDRIRSQRKLTTITVAHRLSTIVNSDQIAVIADGTIQELGTHRVLIKEGGIYALLCEGQGLKADAGATATKTKNNKKSKPSSSNVSGEILASPKESSAIETKVVVKGAKDNLENLEAGIINNDYDNDDGDDSGPDISGVLSRLWDYNKGDMAYTVLGYIGGIVVGALPACEGTYLFYSLRARIFSFSSVSPSIIKLCVFTI